MSRKIRRHFTDIFKQQIVALHTAGMKRSLHSKSLSETIQPRKTTESDCDRFDLCPCWSAVGLCLDLYNR